MRALLALGWRNIWRNRRRTLISLCAVSAGLVLVIFYSGLLGSILGEAKDQLDNVGMGHVEITAAGWRMHRRATENFADPGGVIARLGLPAGSETGWRVVARALISSARASDGVELQGVNWSDEARLSLHVRDVRKGRRPADDDDSGILIGEKLAQKLKVAVGSKLRITLQRADGELGAGLFRVRGIFHSLSPAISEHKALVGSAAAEKLLGVDGVAHQIVIQLERADDADRIASRLRHELGPAYEVRSYGELLPMLRNIERLGDKIVWFTAAFVYALVGLGILNTMLMSVLERTREFGVLRAIGTRPGRVVAQVLAESFWIATLGAAIGLAVGLCLTWYGSHHALIDIGGNGGGEALEYAGTVMRSAVKTRFLPGEALHAASLVYLMAVVTALYPAWRVARISPAIALRSS